LSKAIEIESTLKSLDDKIALIQDTRNQLESMIYDVRDKLDDQYKPVVEPKRLEEHKQTISGLMDKLDDEDEISKDVVAYSKDIKLIRSLIKPLDKLLVEHNIRPQVVRKLENQIHEYSKTVETADYMDVEKKNKVHRKCEEVNYWLKSKLREQKKLPLWAEVAVSSSRIKQRIIELDMVCKELCQKPPSPPPEKEEEGESEKNDATPAEASSTNNSDKPVERTTAAGGVDGVSPSDPGEPVTNHPDAPTC